MKRKEKDKNKKIDQVNENKRKGMSMITNHPLFSRLDGFYRWKSKEELGKDTAAITLSDGDIYLNEDYFLEPAQWAYVIAHCLLHLAFGHFDAEKMPGEMRYYDDGTSEWKVTADKQLWNLACDIYVAKFLDDMKFGKPLNAFSLESFGANLRDEVKIYEYLKEHGVDPKQQTFGTASIHAMDMRGLEKPCVYDESKGEENYFMSSFAEAMVASALEAVAKSGGYDCCYFHNGTAVTEARDWFINHYPLLGGLAHAFRIEESPEICRKEEISIAAINVSEGILYINPAAGLSSSELCFVIAHELLHAGLQHDARCQGRDFELWNAACDFVINGWLCDMHIGKMPEHGLLYDPKYKDWSAESIYDELVVNIREARKLSGFRGYGQGDIIRGSKAKLGNNSVSLDEYCRNALMQGLEYHMSTHRGLLPAGLTEEIRALSAPPVPWDVQLAEWFDFFFPPIEKRHTYARPGRRQGSTPDIPRPSYTRPFDEVSRTFGVIIDTSGSMSREMLGKALGSIASYALSRDVNFARVVFCDAKAYDAGYLSPEYIAGHVEMKGFGGTVLQPAVDLLEETKDFPENGPVLIITDGFIESNLKVKASHAFLLPKGNTLPFRPKGQVFYFE